MGYTEAPGPAAYIGRARVVPLRNTGAALSPFNAFLIQGIKTLALRMDRINENALAVAQHLQQHPKVNWVNYAGLPGNPSDLLPAPSATTHPATSKHRRWHNRF